MGGEIISESGGGIIPLRGAASSRNWGAASSGISRTHEQADYFQELQLKTTSPECAARYFDVVSDFDITDLPSEVKAPTLAMDVRDDLDPSIRIRAAVGRRHPLRPFHRLARLNHLFLEHERSFSLFFEEVNLFLRG